MSLQFENKSYTKQTLKSISKHQFSKNENEKYSIQFFNASSEGINIYNGTKYNLLFENTFYFLKEINVKKVGKGPFINTKIPLFENIPQKTEISTNLSSINLNEEEMNFLKLLK